MWGWERLQFEGCKPWVQFSTLCGPLGSSQHLSGFNDKQCSCSAVVQCGDFPEALSLEAALIKVAVHYADSSSFTGFYFTTHLRVLASSVLRFRDHTQWHNTVGRTPLDEWSARRRELYLTNTQHPQQTNMHVPGGIRTRNPSRRAAANPRLRPLCHWDRHLMQTRRHK
jgi:hypothetical protein